MPNPLTETAAFFLVCGMHRSGTSAVAGALQNCGVSFGTELIPAAADNPKGFFEAKQAVSINEQLLASCSQDWYTVSPTPAFDTQLEGYRELRAQAVTFVDDLRAGDGFVVGLKDPRVSITLPFWMDSLSASMQNPRLILCLRDPLAVVKSLFARNRFSPIRSVCLWIKYNLEILLACRDTGKMAEVHVVDVDRLIEGDRASLPKPLRDFLFEVLAFDEECFFDFLDPSLMHDSQVQCRMPEGAILDLSRDIFDTLRTQGISTEKLEEWLLKWRQQSQALLMIDTFQYAVGEYSAADLGWIEQINAELAVKNQHIARLEGYIDKLLDDLKDYREGALVHAKKVEELSSKITEKVAEVESLHGSLKLSLDNSRAYFLRASELEETVLHAEERYSELESQLRHKQDELNAIYESTSWKVTLPLRKLKTLGSG